jgi:preprotein translocase subunit SecA
MPDGYERTNWDYNLIYREAMQVFPIMDFGTVEDLEKCANEQELVDLLIRWAEKAYEQKIEEFGEDWPRIEKFILLHAITQKWTEHLQMIEQLREGIRYRGYGQIDPLIAFRKESHQIFEETLSAIGDFVATHIYRARVERPQMPRPKMQEIPADQVAAATQASTPTDSRSAPTGISSVDWSKVKRNDLCPCGSGKKFKHCCYHRVVNQ